ncbi:MAG: HDOD domain-containing protein [bacterium]|nr:HDOD domain-containing protein [bacterium]
MTEENVFEEICKGKEITSLPQVLAEVIRVTDQDDASVKDLARVILKDPALTARLLRIVNSPIYGARRNITTVNQAVVVLGMRAVKAIALSTGMYQMFTSKETVVERKAFWRHSLETAINCREIARLCHYKPSEEAFVVGLMHDLGLLIMERNFPVPFKALWENVLKGKDLLQEEQKTFDTNHAAICRFVMERWKLPEILGTAIGFHHTPFSDTRQLPEELLPRILHLGNLISKFRTYPSAQLDETTMEQIDALAESMGITPIALANLQHKILGMLPSESKFLDIEIGSVTELLEAANNLIYKQYFLVEKVLRDNRRIQEQLATDQMKKAALVSLKTITATLSHYINNVSSTIMGRAQLVQLAISQGTVTDSDNVAGNSMQVVIRSLETISLILSELKEMSSFETTKYSDATSILDIEDRLKVRIDALEKNIG